MRIVWRTCATIAAALAFSTAAPADEADIFAHYDAYESAFEAGRYDVADTEAEAAWRAAEAEWGGVEDTAVLAFNLLRVRLMADRRAESIEAARWLAQLVERGAAGASVRPEEAVLFRRLAEFNGENPSRSDLRELKEALEAYRPTDFATRRIDWLGWSYVANGYSLREQWRDAAGAADRAGGLMMEDATAPLALRTTVALNGARAAYESNQPQMGILAAKRGLAAYPPLPPDAPLDPALTSLLVWDEALRGLYLRSGGGPYVPPDPALANPAWDDLRSPAEKGCMVALLPPPGPPGPPGPPRAAGPQPQGIGRVFEYRLAADGSVESVVTLDPATPDEVHPFVEVLRTWKAAAPPDREECRGPWVHVVGFLPPPD